MEQSKEGEAGKFLFSNAVGNLGVAPVDGCTTYSCSNARKEKRTQSGGRGLVCTDLHVFVLFYGVNRGPCRQNFSLTSGSGLYSGFDQICICCQHASLRWRLYTGLLLSLDGRFL